MEIVEVLLLPANLGVSLGEVGHSDPGLEGRETLREGRSRSRAWLPKCLLCSC